jgi:iron complex transport system substrate-binding protein
MSGYPERIVCLSEETTETLYLLGESQRIVGISGFTVRPPQARKEKPKVAAFTSAKLDKILALEPDLVLAFSDLQADIAAALARAGLAVHVFNHDPPARGDGRRERQGRSPHRRTACRSRSRR